MGLHDKRINEINERNRSKIEAQSPFAVAMEIRDHNIKAVRQEKATECKKDCKYLTSDNYMHICLDCFKGDKYNRIQKKVNGNVRKKETSQKYS